MDNIVLFIKEKVNDIVGDDLIRKLSEHDTFRDVGVDSIDYAAMVMEIEEHYNIDLIEGDIPWHKIDTIYKLAEVVNERVESNN